jgi:queuine/archaeosine tRNA-ribosyltransferase
MELGAKVPDGLRHRTATDLAFLDFAGTAVNGLAPLRFGVKVHDVIKTDDELMGQEGPILSRQGQHFGDFFSGNAHVRYFTAMAG